MKKPALLLLVLCLALPGCTLSLKPSPTAVSLPSPTPGVAAPVPTLTPAAPTPTLPPPTAIPTAFCSDGRVNSLITSLGSAFLTRDGAALAALISPVSGLDLRLWRGGTVINFDREHARWIFESTYSHNWGADGASGLDTVGSFSSAVFPKLQEVFSAAYTTACNDPGVAASFSIQPWPSEYAGKDYYQVFKPGTPGVDLDFRLWLVGVEYVDGSPYVFSLIHFQWEP